MKPRLKLFYIDGNGYKREIYACRRFPPLSLPSFSTKISRFINFMLLTTSFFFIEALPFAATLPLFCQNTGTDKNEVSEATHE